MAACGNHTVKAFTVAGEYYLEWSGEGSGDGQFLCVEGLGTNGTGPVYAMDGTTMRLQLFSHAGTFLGSYGTTGHGNGQFAFPHSVALNATGHVYVADAGNHRIQVFSPGVPVPDNSGIIIAIIAVACAGVGGGLLVYWRLHRASRETVPGKAREK